MLISCRSIIAEVLFNVTPGISTTVNLKLFDALIDESSLLTAVTVMVAVPMPTGVTTASLLSPDTVATFVLLLLHVKLSNEDGAVAVTFRKFPSSRLSWVSPVLNSIAGPIGVNNKPYNESVPLFSEIILSVCSKLSFEFIINSLLMV